MEINKEILRVYEKMVRVNNYEKSLVNAGIIITPLEVGASIIEALYQKNIGGAVALGLCALGTGYFSYKIHKKTKESEQKIKFLEAIIE